MELFMEATKKKYRFQTRIGVVSVEDLWDMKLEDLDSIYKQLSAKLKEFNEFSLLQTKSADTDVVEKKMEILKAIVDTKMEEANAKKMAQEEKKRKQRIMELIASKENESLANMSIEELKKML